MRRRTRRDTELNSKFITKSYTFSGISIAASSASSSYTKQADISIDGYKPILIGFKGAYGTGSGYVHVYGLGINGNSLEFNIRNFHTSSISINITFTILYEKI